MKTTVSTNGQIVLPIELRMQDRIRAGEQFEVERLKAGEYLLKKLRPQGRPGLLNWLFACPDKGWFRALPSEATDQF